ncbi:MAG: lipoprotein-releasing ABC transporter permease subunit [candidate division NC10 bacterium]|jgi:lipoprotein-releasing system permease protein|nr:lipoprotein-releasing ABC transporter permease subunit [candidate division NC10 bacterium]MCZ6550785.1 lipoprotein-releasing ABC transporter permease subunit [candidate division NC10 bacterium]
MQYEILIGLRYLKSKRREAVISLITLISSGGVALGVMALIVVLSVMSGFEKDLRDKILGTNAHVVLLRFGEGGITDVDKLLPRITPLPHVAAAAPFTLHQVMLTSRHGVMGAVLRGIDPEREGQVTDLARNMKKGSLDALSRDGEGIILGKSLAASLGISVGDPVNVVSPVGGGVTPLGMAPRVKQFTVVGVFEAGMYEYDAGLAYIPIPAAQTFFRMGKSVTGVEIKLDDIYQAPQVAGQMQEELRFPFYTRTWMEMNKNLFSALKLEKTVMFIILVMIVLVAAFGVVSTLTMLVMEKTREIAILKSMGATAAGIMRIFILDGVVIGAVGTLVGLLGGLVVTKNLDRIVSFVERVFGIDAFPGDVYFLDKLPHQINAPDVVVVVIVSLIISFLATLYPSWQASRLNPVDALRYE